MGVSATYERHLALANANKELATSQAKQLLAQEQLLQSERARTGLLGEFGKNTPSTYEEYKKSVEQPNPISDVTYPRWLEITAGDEFHGNVGAAGANIVHPGKAVEFYKNTPTFKFLSAKQAQLTEGSLFGRGELFKNYEESIMNPIIEGSAASWREAQQLISRNAARGGSARRLALAAAQKMRVAEEINRNKAQNLWQASLALRQYMDQAANAQIAFNQAWTNNLGFIRDQYNQAFQSLADFYAGTILPQSLALSEFQFSSAVTLDTIERAEKLAREQKKRALIQAGLGLALAAVGGFGLIGGATGALKTISSVALQTGGAMFASSASGGGVNLNLDFGTLGTKSPGTPNTPGGPSTKDTGTRTNISTPKPRVGILP